ncbi:MAG: 3'-5' exonuclease [Pseudomonas sp.]|uniref:3'-5' exonuclease n=1 Tax=Pseudomonas sp. TaxID=306 RepID=UPI003392C0BA
MRWLPWGRTAAPTLSAEQRQRLAALPVPLGSSQQPLNRQRFVVLDLETSGLNTQRDRVLSIGAWVIEDGAIDLGQQFECTLCHLDQPVNASVLIHGLAPSTLAAGREPVAALLDCLAFLGDSPLLAFHAPFDQRMLGRAVDQQLGQRLASEFLDIAELAPLLNPQVVLRNAGLDDWTAHFGLRAQQRHSASADALVTAELALILFHQARRQGLDSLDALQRRLAQWRRRQHSPAF